MLIGFSSGCFYHDRRPLAPETFSAFALLGCTAIEIACPREAAQLLDIKAESLSFFQYISIHSPSLKGLSPDEVEDIFRSIKAFASKFSVASVVIHPDEVKNWKILRKYNLPLAVENMDANKDSFKQIEDFEHLFKEEDYLKLVLDLGHVYSEDETMELAQEFVKSFGDRLDHIHISADAAHNAIFATESLNVLQALPGLSLPIIIESGILSIDEGRDELSYITKNINKAITYNAR